MLLVTFTNILGVHIISRCTEGPEIKSYSYITTSSYLTLHHQGVVFRFFLHFHSPGFYRYIFWHTYVESDRKFREVLDKDETNRCKWNTVDFP